MHSDYGKENIQSFVRCFEAGCKGSRAGLTGMELEQFVVTKKDHKAVSYYGEHGIEALLERLSVYFPRQGREGEHLFGLGDENYVLSVEPAAQFEISIMPQERLRSIAHLYQDFLHKVTPILEEWDYELLPAGYCIREPAEELALIPKRRYQFMDRYFGEIGIYGRCMMRGTASVQAALDYSDEEDFVRTYRMAVCLGPLFALITDNAPVFEGRPYRRHMARTYIWEHVDQSRCSLVPGTFEESFGFAAYARYLYQVPAIFIQDADGRERYVGGKSLCDLCNARQMTQEELEHGISIVFPDVRLKQYIELRSGDSVPFLYAMGYIAFVKGIFMDRAELYQMYRQMEQFLPDRRMSEEAVQQGKQQLMMHGYAGMIYGQTAAYWTKQLVEFAEKHLDSEERAYLEPVKRLVESQLSVRDCRETASVGNSGYGDRASRLPIMK